MKNEIKRNVEIILTLNGGEAQWLHEIMQNPIHCENPADESPTDNAIRHMFFNATKF